MKIALILILLTFALPALADEHVNGYYRQNGTYVEPHYQTAPDNNRYDNYSTRGNTNPYTGQAGRVNPEAISTYGTHESHNSNNPYNPYR